MSEVDHICEQAILGAILFDKSNIDKIKFILKPSDFYGEFFRHIYAAMLTLDERGESFNLNTLAAELAPHYPDKNVFSELADFSRNSKMPLDVVHYAGIVIETRKRKDYDQFLDTQKLYNSMRKPLPDLLEANLAFVDNLFEGMKFARGYELAEVWVRFLEAKEAESEGRKSFKILTGYPEVDRITEGFREGNLITIAAESGAGKTTFGLNLLKNIAVNDKIPVLLLSLEMNAMEVASSTLASMTLLTQTQLKKEAVAGAAYDHMLRMGIAAIERIEGVKFTMYCENIERIQQAIRTIRMHLKAVPDCKVVMVDYIGLMNSGDVHKDNRVQQVTFMTKALKNLAMEAGIVILMLAQLNRDNKDHRRPPSLSDLRESGSIAFDSNAVIFIERLEHNARIHVAKNRNGPTGNTMLGFNGATARFFSLEGDIDDHR